MSQIDIITLNQKDTLRQIQDVLGGKLIETSNEFNLIFDNEHVKGTIKYIPFDWGVNLLDFDIEFSKDVILKIEASEFNPIRFIYTHNGDFKHRFGINNEEKLVEQFHSLIFTNKKGGFNYVHFPKNKKLEVNIIQIVRKKFLQKRTTNVSLLNDRLYDVFVDTDHDNRFSHYGALNLRMSDYIKKLKKIKSKGMVRILKIESIVYDMLSLHIEQHNKFLRGVQLPVSLSKTELKGIRKLEDKIIKNPSFSYSLEQLSIESALSQAKLQDGFRFLYNRTVTEYVRHIRLQAARELMRSADLNVSQVVYSIGFTSRSYFSKIFKEKYGITPNEYRKSALNNLIIEESAA
ncbi:helix-turn-helix transcriptional regulator [Psychroserpens burtonensis]|uniref:Helix-turn-helix transcriptional regulator n=2 Tax=Psychroserpens burtonensis TaxID=49278 RepID=A0A5C7BAM1_9FLAO|nr:AraC family transcriptional regulator [Psychroserpens burtonensis]TXE19952.1 helix-turn-helix transcriptional regulator [Psychroserpens burtonensis]